MRCTCEVLLKPVSVARPPFSGISTHESADRLFRARSRRHINAVDEIRSRQDTKAQIDYQTLTKSRPNLEARRWHHESTAAPHPARQSEALLIDVVLDVLDLTGNQPRVCGAGV